MSSNLVLTLVPISTLIFSAISLKLIRRNVDLVHTFSCREDSVLFYHTSRFNFPFAGSGIELCVFLKYFLAFYLIRWHMTPADVNAYYNSPNNYIGLLSSNSGSFSLENQFIIYIYHYSYVF